MKKSFATSKAEHEDVTMASVDLFRATWTIMTSLIVFVFGMVGNVTILYIYSRGRELRHSKVFELILAAFDIYALVVLLDDIVYSFSGQQAFLDQQAFQCLGAQRLGFVTHLLPPDNFQTCRCTL